MKLSKRNSNFQFVYYWKSLEIVNCEEERSLSIVTGDLCQVGAGVIFRASKSCGEADCEQHVDCKKTA